MILAYMLVMKFEWSYWIFTICAIFSSVYSTFGQHNALDSLRQKLSVESNDSSKAVVLAEIGDLYYDINFDSSVYYYNEAIKLSQEIPYFSIEYSSWRSLGYVYSYRKNDFDASLSFFRKAADLGAAHFDSVAIAYALSDMGRIFWKQGEPYKALEYHLEVRAIGEKINSPKVMLRANTSLGIIENENGNNDKAISYYREALLIARSLNKDRNQGVLFNNLGKAHQDDGEYTLALKYFHRSDSVFTVLKDDGWISLVSFNIGKNFILQGYYEEGIEFYKSALKLNEKIENKEREVMIKSGLAVAYLKSNEPEKSIAVAENALKTLKQIDTKLYYDELYKNLGVCYELIGDHYSASQYFERYVRFMDETNESEVVNKIASLNHQYELQRKENKVLKLKVINIEKDKNLQIASSNLKILMLAFLSLLFFFLFAVLAIRLKAFKKIEKIKTNLANDLHDNIGTSLNHIKMLSGRMNKNQVTSQEKEYIIAKIKNTSNELLYNMHDMVWSLDKNKETIGDLLERIQDHADVCLGDFNVPYKFKIEDLNQDIVLRPKEKINAYLIFKESINNILKHTKTVEVLVSVSKENAEHLKMYISSFYNAKKEEERLSNQKGLKSMEKRAKELGGQFRIIDKPGNFIVEFSF